MLCWERPVTVIVAPVVPDSQHQFQMERTRLWCHAWCLASREIFYFLRLQEIVSLVTYSIVKSLEGLLSRQEEEQITTSRRWSFFLRDVCVCLRLPLKICRWPNFRRETNLDSCCWTIRCLPRFRTSNSICLQSTSVLFFSKNWLVLQTWSWDITKRREKNWIRLRIVCYFLFISLLLVIIVFALEKLHEMKFTAPLPDTLYYSGRKTFGFQFLGFPFHSLLILTVVLCLICSLVTQFDALWLAS